MFRSLEKRRKICFGDVELRWSRIGFKVDEEGWNIFWRTAGGKSLLKLQELLLFVRVELQFNNMFHVDRGRLMSPLEENRNV